MAEDFNLYVVNSISICFMIRHSLKGFPSTRSDKHDLYLLPATLYMYFKPLLQLKFILGGDVKWWWINLVLGFHNYPFITSSGDSNCMFFLPASPLVQSILIMVVLEPIFISVCANIPNISVHQILLNYFVHWFFQTFTIILSSVKEKRY